METSRLPYRSTLFVRNNTAREDADRGGDGVGEGEGERGMASGQRPAGYRSPEREPAARDPCRASRAGRQSPVYGRCVYVFSRGTAAPPNGCKHFTESAEWRRWSVDRKSRQEEVTLCRLRIGHTYATHGYLLRGEDRPECPRCNEPLTVAHALLACRRYAEKRSRYLGYIPPTMSLHRLLADDSRWVQDGSIFAFIRSVDFPVIFSSY